MGSKERSGPASLSPEHKAIVDAWASVEAKGLVELRDANGVQVTVDRPIRYFENGPWFYLGREIFRDVDGELVKLDGLALRLANLYEPVVPEKRPFPIHEEYLPYDLTDWFIENDLECWCGTQAERREEMVERSDGGSRARDRWIHRSVRCSLQVDRAIQ